MRLNLVRKSEMVQSPWNGQLICTAIEAIPFILYAYWLKGQKYYWISAEDQKNGRQLFNELGANMLLGCGKEIVDAVHLLYMQQDNIHNGTNYTYTTDSETGEITFSPAIPIVPPNTALYSQPGTRGQNEDLRDLLLNTFTGTPTADYNNPRGTNVILEEILAALSTASEEEQLEILRAILTALGGVVL